MTTGSNLSSILNEAASAAHLQKCRDELNMLHIKEEVMREELNEASMKQTSAKNAIKTKEHSLNLLSTEKGDALERMQRVQREI